MHSNNLCCWNYQGYEIQYNFVLTLLNTNKNVLFSKFQEEELKSAILVVLANKQDMEGAMTVAEVHSALGLDALRTRTFQIFKTSAIKGEGLDQSMDWLANALATRKWDSVAI